MSDHHVLGKFSPDNNTLWRPTMRLRWFQIGERTSPVGGKIVPGVREPIMELQQCWLSPGGAEEWRAIPSVFEAAYRST